MVLLTPVALLGVLDRRMEHDPEGLRERAEELLSRPPYSEAEPGPIARAVEWVIDTVGRLLDIVFGGLAATGSVGAWVIAVIGAIVLAIVVWRLTRGASLDRGTPEVPSTPSSRTAGSWAEEARSHEQAGRLHDAVRCWYAALAVGLVEDGTLDDVPGRTVRELNAEVARAAPRLAAAIEVAGERFETVVYGGADATPGDVGNVRDAATSVLAVRT